MPGEQADGLSAVRTAAQSRTDLGSGLTVPPQGAELPPYTHTWPALALAKLPASRLGLTHGHALSTTSTSPRGTCCPPALHLATAGGFPIASLEG